MITEIQFSYCLGREKQIYNSLKRFTRRARKPHCNHNQQGQIIVVKWDDNSAI